jgi:Holliday junction DNA helicase RuvB
MEYESAEKRQIIARYLQKYDIKADASIIEQIDQKVDAVPREIHNLCVKLRDFIVSQIPNNDGILDRDLREKFVEHIQIDDGGLTRLHQKYLEILEKNDRPLGVKTIAIQLGINEKAVEEDLEPLLMKLGKIEKTAAGRVLI